MNKLNFTKFNKLFLMLFLIIQPFLDIYVFFTNPSLQIFGLTIPTIVRCLGIFVLMIFSLIKTKYNKSYKYIFAYFAIFSIYFILHNYYCSKDIEVFKTFKYSFFEEGFYLVRMMFPFVMVFISQIIKLEKEKFLKIIYIISLIIGIVIFGSNTLGISLASYGGDTVISIPWYKWSEEIFSIYTFQDLASKGWFFMANQISGVMILLLPFNYYGVIKYPKVLNISSSILLTISMIFIGTRVASYGWMIVAFIILLMYCYFIFIKKEAKLKSKGTVAYILLLSVCSIFMSTSIISTRQYEIPTNDIISTNDNLEELNKFLNDDSSEGEKINYLIENFEKYKIQAGYIKTLYPCYYDVDFWFRIFIKSVDKVLDNRDIEYEILEDILNDNKPVYKYFGLSFSRLRNGKIYYERDFFAQYYSFGIIGVILLFIPYFTLIILSVYKILKNYKDKFSFFNLTILFSVCFTMCASIFSGHLLDELFITIFLGYILGYLYERVK